MVYLIFQRYKFKSKSQLSWPGTTVLIGVFDIPKIQIQKQITTKNELIPFHCLVYLIFQRYKFKSKSQLWMYWFIWYNGVFDISKIQIQKQITTVEIINNSCFRCIWYFKDTNSKANHNALSSHSLSDAGVFDISKIQIQKQITTMKKTPKNYPRVYLIFQRYKFKSKSQQHRTGRENSCRCIWYFKDTNSKANHN